VSKPKKPASVRDVVAPPTPAMSKMEEVGSHSRAMACGGRHLRRSPRLIRMKDLSACASEQDLILKLKKEAKALKALQRERLARDGLLDSYMEGRQQAAERYLGRMAAAADAPQPAAAGKKRKKVVKSTVPQELMDWYILHQHSNPFKGICDDLELGKHSKRFRQLYAERVAIWNKDLEYQQALIKQFRTKGYAYDYTEVTDTSDDDDN
jgi:hypothetical protein